MILGWRVALMIGATLLVIVADYGLAPLGDPRAVWLFQGLGLL